MKQFFITLVLLFSFSLHSARPLSPTTALEEQCFKEATNLGCAPLAYHSIISATAKRSTSTTHPKPKEKEKTPQKHPQGKRSLRNDKRNVAKLTAQLEDATIAVDRTSAAEKDFYNHPQEITITVPSIQEHTELYDASFIPSYLQTAAEKLIQMVGGTFSNLSEEEQQQVMEKVTQEFDRKGSVEIKNTYLHAFAYTLIHDTPLDHNFALDLNDSPIFSDFFLYNQFITFLKNHTKLINQAQANNKPDLLAIFDAYQNAYTDNHPPCKLAQIRQNLLAQRQKLRREQARLDTIEEQYPKQEEEDLEYLILTNLEQRHASKKQ